MIKNGGVHKRGKDRLLFPKGNSGAKRMMRGGFLKELKNFSNSPSTGELGDAFLKRNEIGFAFIAG